MVGVDEVGRGCWAGPLLVVAARARSALPGGLKDSKLLTKQQREAIFSEIIAVCDFGEGWVGASEIDSYGLAKALRLGIKRALNSLGAELGEEIILDGKINYLPQKFLNARTLVDADNLIPIVSAASIYAKVRRDRYMAELAKKYPNYQFDTHVGYGTKSHLLAVKQYGVLKTIHRYSYRPIAQLLSPEVH